MEVTRERVRVRINRTAVALLSLAGIALSVGLAWACIGLHVTGVGSFGVVAAGYIAVGISGFITLLLVRRLFSRRMGLVIDRHGIVDQLSYLGVGKIRWADIKRLRLVSVLGIKVVVIRVYDPQRYVDRGNVLQRFLKSMYRATMAHPVIFTLPMFAAPAGDIVAAINHFFDQAMGRRVSPSA
jgi:hypothetical protein